MTQETPTLAAEANIFATNPEGFKVHFKLITDNPAKIVANMETLAAGLVTKGYTPDASMNHEAAPAPRGRGKENGATDVPVCKDCGGPVWDNRGNKRSPKSPDFKCKDRDCEAAGWLDKKSGEVRWQSGE